MNLRFIPISLAVAALLAQGPGIPMHRMTAALKTTAVQSYLNLTDAQIASLQQLRQSEMAALKPIFQQAGPLRQSLRQQEESSTPDSATISKLAASLQALQQQAAPIRASFQQQALAVLTPDQASKLTALQSAMALMPAVHEATALNLLTPPQGTEGAGPGPEFMPHGRFRR